MAAIFNGPVAPVGAEDLLGVGLIRCPAGDPINGFLGTFSGLFFYEFPFDNESLADVREIEIGRAHV